MSLNILDKQINNWLKNEVRVNKYISGLQLLEESGIFNILQRIGIPSFINNGYHVQEMASQAAFSSGFQTCLEQLRHFREVYTEAKEVAQTAVGKPNFNGDNLALIRGDLRKEDIKD